MKNRFIKPIIEWVQAKHELEQRAFLYGNPHAVMNMLPELGSDDAITMAKLFLDTNSRARKRERIRHYAPCILQQLSNRAKELTTDNTTLPAALRLLFFVAEASAVYLERSRDRDIFQEETMQSIGCAANLLSGRVEAQEVQSILAETPALPELLTSHTENDALLRQAALREALERGFSHGSLIKIKAQPSALVTEASGSAIVDITAVPNGSQITYGLAAINPTKPCHLLYRRAVKPVAHKSRSFRP